MDSRKLIKKTREVKEFMLTSKFQALLLRISFHKNNRKSVQRWKHRQLTRESMIWWVVRLVLYT